MRSVVQLSFALFSLGTVVLQAEKKPNIVYLMADDLGYGDVKCFGLDRCKLATPAFDRLAKEGMRFTDAHSVSSVCIPSRLAIMTGRYPWRFERPRPDGPWGYVNPRMKTDQFTIGRLLQSAGYRTAYVGKWHLGTLMETVDGKNQTEGNVDFTKPLKVGPQDFGFDESFILPGSLDMYPYVFARDNQWIGKVNRKRGWSAFNRVGATEETFEDWKVLDTFSREAEAFLERQSKKEEPFFLYVALTSPHTPTSPHPRFKGKSEIGAYGDFVMETDDCLGRVLRALDTHGVTENTLVIATSDHGPAPYAGPILKATYGQVQKMEAQGHYPSGPFRGYKFSVYEGGLRIPFVARWPGVAPAGTTCERLIGLNDMMATFAEISGTKLKPDQGPDSVSIAPLLKKPGSHGTRRGLVMQSTQSFVVRKGAWKLALCPGSGSRTRWGNLPKQEEVWREALAAFGEDKPNAEDLKKAPFVQLFDLGKDPKEEQNLAKAKPEKVVEILREMEAAVKRGRTTAGPDLKNDRKHVRYWPYVP